MSELGRLEQGVLDVYKKVNPSEIRIEEEEVYEKWKQQREILLIERLKLLPSAYQQTRLLEVGGGTGENTILYSQWGADVTLVDFNPLALNRATYLWKRFGCSATRAIEAAVFDLPQIDLPTKSFDFVFCEGVIHHTEDPLQAVRIMLQYVKPGGILMLAFAEAFGIKARLLQRAYVEALAGRNENKIIAIAKEYFQEHLDRCAKFGGRSELSVIYDSFVNPQVLGIDLLEITDQLHIHGFQYYSGSPELHFPYATAPYNQPPIDIYDPRLNRQWVRHLQKHWLVCGRVSDEEKFMEAQGENIQEEEKYLRLEQQIKSGGSNVSAQVLSMIQKGYLGVGLHYLVSLKTRKECGCSWERQV